MPAQDLIGTPFLDLGFLFARVLVGLLIAAHGAQKLFGWFGGHGLEGTGQFFAQLGFRPGRLFALGAGLGEFTSGLLIAVGLFGPVGPALMLAVMVVAALSVHWRNGLFATNNGIELPLLYSIAAVRFALTGPGRHSLDAMLGLHWTWTPRVIWIALAVGVVGGVLNLSLRRPAAAPPA
ncbi:MAG TPA: DoxX family protein [Gemmatimonadales bacterium]|nr:DoxX family protein [Gemmatimonadales bacterium]